MRIANTSSSAEYRSSAHATPEQSYVIYREIQRKIINAISVKNAITDRRIIIVYRLFIIHLMQ